MGGEVFDFNPTKPYAIAQYLPLDSRQHAVQASYQLRKVDTLPGKPTLLVTEGWCDALGVVLAHWTEGRMRAIAHRMYCDPGLPCEDDLAAAVCWHPEGDLRQWGPVSIAAERFIADWDAGKITDLAAAFDVEGER